MVRDVFRMLGVVQLDHTHQIVQIFIRQTDPLAKPLSASLATILAQQHIAVILGEI